MTAIELKSRTNRTGNLKIDFNLGIPEIDVRILILYEDRINSEEELAWHNSISKNPAFDFLNDPDEDIYSITDGEPFNS